MTILLAVLIMIDFMFLDDSHFIFDPSIQVLAAAAGVRTALAPALSPCEAPFLTSSLPPYLSQNYMRRTAPSP